MATETMPVALCGDEFDDESFIVGRLQKAILGLL